MLLVGPDVGSVPHRPPTQQVLSDGSHCYSYCVLWPQLVSFPEHRVSTFVVLCLVFALELHSAVVGRLALSSCSMGAGVHPCQTEARCGDGDKIAHSVLREMPWALEFIFRL